MHETWFLGSFYRITIYDKKLNKIFARNLDRLTYKCSKENFNVFKIFS